MSRRGRRSGRKRSRTPWIILALVVVLGVVAYFIFTQSGAGSGSQLNGQPVDQSILNALSGVSLNTLNTVGSGPAGVTALKPTGTTTPLTSNNKPEVLYMGAEYCPFCAVERWSMIVALDKFGNFTGLQFMQSAPLPEAFPNTPTFTFRAATYTSKYISFVSVEQTDRNHVALQTATADQTALLNQYDTQGSIPFLDLGNSYSLVGSQFQPPVFRVGQSATGAPYNWTQIASQLNNSSSPFAQSVDGAANRLIAAICKIDGAQPSSVCSQGFAQIVGFVRTAQSGGPQLLVPGATTLEPHGMAPRYAPNRSIAHL